MNMIERVRPAQPRVPVSPQLALRVAVLGAAALVMFGIIFFRLWYLQVLSGDQYVQQANANRVRDLPIPAPRGEIVDRDGRRIVTTRTTNAVQIVPSALPSGHARTLLYRRLGRLLDVHPGRIQALVKTHQPPYANVTIKTDAGPAALTVLAERQNEFPGVTQQPVSIRDYPLGDVGAQIFGYVGQINSKQLRLKGFNGVKQGTVVGKDGVEFYYDRYLRGTPGIQRVEVNSLGQTEPTRIAPTEPKSGYDVKLSIDLGLEREGWSALQQGIGLANANGNPANAGAFMAMDPRNGQVLAMGSYPSFDPNKLARPITPAEYARVTGSNGAVPAPLTNRAVNGTYPTGSTFKPITAMGALQAGIISPSTALGAGQCISVSSQQFCNSGKANFGALDLQNALRVSSDTYFFQVGELANSHGNVIQNMARELGIGQRTDIDLPSEITGIVPDRKWRASVAAKELSCERRTHKPSCGISDGRQWSVGDNMHLAVGQGDLITSPLQMAVAYSTLANAYSNQGEGTVVRPHLGMEVDDSQGGLVRTLGIPPARHVSLSYSDLQVVMSGLHAATSQPGGTSQDVWAGWNQTRYPVYGKTGTAQHGVGTPDQAWYMCYLPDSKRPIVIAVTIESGGFGDQSAAPVARLMASEWFHQKKKLVAGASKTL